MAPLGGWLSDTGPSSGPAQPSGVGVHVLADSWFPKTSLPPLCRLSRCRRPFPGLLPAGSRVFGVSEGEGGQPGGARVFSEPAWEQRRRDRLSAAPSVRWVAGSGPRCRCPVRARPRHGACRGNRKGHGCPLPALAFLIRSSSYFTFSIGFY